MTPALGGALSAATPPTRRDQHKTRTRQALIDAALSLFASNGYDATSTEEIAERAGVSPRTFFRYFETKDSVLFFGGDDFNRALVEQLPGHPASLTDLAAIEATLVSLAPSLVRLKPRIRLYFRALSTSAALVGQHANAMAAHEEALAAALARRSGLARPDEHCRIAAATTSVVMSRTLRRWLHEPNRDLARLFAEGFEVVRDVSSGRGRGAAP